MQRILEAVGAFVLTHLANIGRVTLLYGETMRQVTRRLRVRSIVYQMSHLG
ncbi:MAG: ABC transporter permease, partial [Selenomonas artemidis]